MRGASALEQTIGHPSPGRNRIGGLRLVAGLTVAPLIFAAQVIVSFAVAAQTCTAGKLPSPALIIINLVALLILLGALALSWANRQALSGSEGGSTQELHDKGDGRTRFLVEFGLWMSLIFAIASLVEFLGILFLGACAGFAPTL